MLYFKSLFCLSLLIALIKADFFPPGFEPCSLADRKCILKMTQAMVPVLTAGIPEIGTKVLDPMSLKKVTFSLAGLNMDFSDGQVTELSSAVFEDVKLDTDKKVLELTYHTNAKLEGKYVASGRLIVLPITGDGILSAKFKHLNMKLTAPFDIVPGPDGKDRIKLKGYKVKFSIKGNDNAKFKLTNLFGGNEQLASALVTFIDGNGELLTNELGGPIIDAIVKIIFKQVKKFFEANPMENLIKQ